MGRTPMRPSRICLLAGVLLALGWVTASRADVVTTIVTTPITVFEGTGTGSVPLASDPGNTLGDSVDGYGYVDVTATLTQSASMSSAGTTIVTFDLASSSVHVSSVFSLALDIALVDADLRPGREFAAGLPSLLTPAKPLAISVEGDADVLALLNALLALDLTTATDTEVLAAIVGAATVTQSVTDAKYVLGVDVNLNGAPDEMILRTMDLDPAALALDVTDGDLEALLDAITGGAITSPIEIEAGVSVSGVNLSFTGEVRDETTDPPFTLTLFDVSFGTAQATDLPEPSSLVLLLAAGLSLLAIAHRATLRQQRSRRRGPLPSTPSI
jgi:hypothetical protein